jgi:hypothetical protein
LKCAHLVPAKAPLPEEAIFNQNQAAAERRHAVRKAQHKKRQIAKRDRNDDRNKRRKAGEQGVSSDKDPLPEPSWSGDVASAAVDWSNMSGVILVFAAPWCRGVIVAPTAGGGARQGCGVELASGSSPCPSGPSVDPLPYGA